MPTRRLAAIMFTDIAGYTKLMQQSEARANELRTRHREVFENAHQTYNGQIIQYFGDGTLSTFASCVEAVQCAIDMQKDFQEEPKVPLRIGIHLGDIVWSDKDVMGDGVNLASRVESLGIPGSILISDDVNKQIKNQEIETVNMGTFGMKNVDTPLEVFAVQAGGIVLPSPKDLKGKGRRLNNILKVRRLVQFVSVGFLAMAIGALIFWASGAQEKSQLLPASIREEKVAVSVFENFTGDENLDALGYLGSEWISSGLRELKVRTVSPEMVRQHKDRIGILPNNPEGEPSFAEITGAAYVVTGSYFLKGDSLMLNTRLISTISGEEVETHFRQLIAHKDQKEELVEEARQYLLGYWVLKRDQQVPVLYPPKYEAYQVYLGCLTRDFNCYQEVLDIDPNFILARVWLMRSYGALALDSLYNLEKERLEEDWLKLTIFEKNLFASAVAEYEGAFQALFDALNANYQLDSMDYKTTHQTATFASTSLNRTDIAIERLEQIFHRLPQFESSISNQSYFHLFDAYNREGQYGKTIDFYMSLPSELKNNFRPHIDFEVIMAFLYLGRTKEVEEFIQRRGSSRDYILHAAYMHAYLFPDSLRNPFGEQLSKRIHEFPEDPVDWRSINTTYMRFWDSRFLAYYILQDWNRAEMELRKLDQYNWNNYYQLFPFEREAWKGHEQLWLTAAWACVYAHQGKLDSCYLKIEELEGVGELYNDGTHMAYLRGATSYLKARIYAVLGEKEKAVEALKTSIEQGRLYMWWNIYFDLDFVNLKGYPPFEALVAPREN